MKKHRAQITGSLPESFAELVRLLPPRAIYGTPRQRADRPLGQWNQMEVIVRGDSVTVR